MNKKNVIDEIFILNKKIEMLLDIVSLTKDCPKGKNPSSLNCIGDCLICWNDFINKEVRKDEDIR
jgi:hypothetical protein